MKINIPSLKIPEGWEEYEVDEDQDPESDIEVKSFWAPMEGWDVNHHDQVVIFKTPSIDPLTDEEIPSYYYVETYIAYGEYNDDDEDEDGEESTKHSTLRGAMKEAIEIMEDIKSESWNEY
jgi:hypothetical protein